MSDILVQIVFGWPAILLSLTVSVVGILKKWPWLLVVGALLCAPFAWYLSRYQSLCSLAILLPLFQIGAAVALWKDRKWLAWAFLAPLALAIIGLAYLVLAQ